MENILAEQELEMYQDNAESVLFAKMLELENEVRLLREAFETKRYSEISISWMGGHPAKYASEISRSMAQFLAYGRAIAIVRKEQ